MWFNMSYYKEIPRKLVGYFTNLKPCWFDCLFKRQQLYFYSSNKNLHCCHSEREAKTETFESEFSVRISQIWCKKLIWPPPSPITALQQQNQKPAQGMMVQLYSAAECICRIETKWEEKRSEKMYTSSDSLPKAFWIFWTWTHCSKVEPDGQC